jgi:hypothetical protein
MAAPLKILNLEEALAVLRVSPATYHRRRELPRGFRVGGQLRFIESHLVDWLLAQQAAAGASPQKAEAADGPPRLGDAA